MKIRLVVTALATLFTAWLATSYLTTVTATDYPGLSADEVEVTETEEQGEEEKSAQVMFAELPAKL